MLEEHHKNKGWIEVICGSMFSGKTEELLRRIRRVVISKQSVDLFKPSIDNRYNQTQIVSHDQNAIEAYVVNDAEEILSLASSSVIAIDEAQFFDQNLVGVCIALANQNKRVIVAGLDMDYKANAFGPIPELLASAEFVTKLHAICTRCGSVANFTYRHKGGKEQVEIGAQDQYEARCRTCFNIGIEDISEE